MLARALCDKLAMYILSSMGLTISDIRFADVFELADFYYCDNLQVARAHGARFADGCACLQRLARSCSCCGGDRAHRALEDTVALRNVMGHFAAASGLSTTSLLTPFARRFDVHATLLARSFLC